MVGAVGYAQQLPPGTRSVDDHSAEDAARQQVVDAESLLEKGDYAGAEAKLKVLAVSRAKDARVQYDLGYAADHNNDDGVAAEAYAATMRQMNDVAAKVQAEAVDNAKKLKDTEMVLERTTRRVSDMVHVAGYEQESALKATLQHLNAVHTKVLGMVFAH